ncbi:serine/threonine-protein kinase GRIK1-like isoform X2 [Amaranthus tricolor]|uniref:serine/threonine-protein kinase GRIK1-like isoform X2 n=1 Tax=Amaranthus tricolor TaxID=29722 RepID=UPI002586D276|nr:serine/threonine-protein kinase GRIK1-like isoform X2 [Amaranthus tricolor]
MNMGCWGCFGFSRRSKEIARPNVQIGSLTSVLSQKPLLEDGDGDIDGEDDGIDDRLYDGEDTNMTQGYYESEMCSGATWSEEIINYKIRNGFICREFQVKETRKLVRSEDEYGNKMINEYIRELKIGSGSYAKVVFHKSHLLKQRVAPSENAMTDVLREVLIMKIVSHPNIVNLIEVIDDPDTDYFYMVLEYVEGKWDCEGSGPPGGLGEGCARKFLRDIVSGLMYLHSHNIVHMDIKPQNLLVTRSGTVKIADFSVSQVFEGDNDELRRSPGTPVITAPECCLGLTYRGKAADTWAVGITLYCMIMGKFPFIGETLQETYDKIVNDPINLPDDLNPQLSDILEGLLCKDPNQRLTLAMVAEHPWVIGEDGPLPEFSCWCKRTNVQPNSHHEDAEVPSQSLQET